LVELAGQSAIRPFYLLLLLIVIAAWVMVFWLAQLVDARDNA
jgi:hypothetical protein